MTSIGRSTWLAICVIAIAIAIPVIFSGTLRSAYLLFVERKVADIWPPKYAFVGDSLTANCNWRWELGALSVINLAIGGTNIRDIARQILQARQLKADFIFVEGGINDVILESASSERISSDFEYLLQQIPAGQSAVVTLIPFVSDVSVKERIDTANSTLNSLVKARELPMIDLNPKISSLGIRRPGMTTDGVHFTYRACQIWADEIRGTLKSLVR